MNLCLAQSDSNRFAHMLYFCCRVSVGAFQGVRVNPERRRSLIDQVVVNFIVIEQQQVTRLLESFKQEIVHSNTAYKSVGASIAVNDAATQIVVRNLTKATSATLENGKDISCNRYGCEEWKSIWSFAQMLSVFCAEAFGYHRHLIKQISQQMASLCFLVKFCSGLSICLLFVWKPYRDADSGDGEYRLQPGGKPRMAFDPRKPNLHNVLSKKEILA